jgi:hypothetical protein
MKPYITDDERTAQGEKIAEILMLHKQRKNGRYPTTWGDKTALGLFNTLERLINEKQEAI